MVAVVRSNGYGKREAISLPYVACLLEDQGSPPRYYVLPPDEPAPAPGSATAWRSTFPGYSPSRDVARSGGGLSFVFGGSDD